MILDRTTVVEAIDKSSFLFPRIPPRIDYLTIDGVFGFDTAVSHPYTNMVGLAKLARENASAKVKEVFDFFAAQKRAFGWLVGPTSSPHNLGEHLIARGMVKAVDLHGMATDQMHVNALSNPDLTIVEGWDGDFHRAAELMNHAYPLALDACEIFTSAYRQLRADMNTRLYFAHVKGRVDPISIGFSIHFSHTPIVLLAGSATLPSHRRLGAYSALVRRRLTDAARDGFQVAVIQAVRNTSAPICRKLGFRALCDLQMYVWHPPTEPEEG